MRSLLGLGLILVAALLMQLPALETPFFADDYLFLDQAGRGSLLQTLASPDPIGNFHRPVGRQLYFWLLSRAGGGSPRVFHAVGLALWLVVLALLFAVARRLAGARAALIATGVVALHYAADVPVRWASGSQDLLAVAGALGALWLHLAGFRLGAGAVLLVALLSKEVVVLTPLVAVVAARGPGQSWRAAALRAWPLAAAAVAWALLAWSASHGRTGAVERLAMAPGAALGAALAALAHLLQVVVAVEWSARSTGGFPSTAPWLASLALVLIALAMGAQRAARPAARAATRSATTPDREAAHAPPAGARPGPATRGGARADRRRSRGEAAGARGMLVGVAWALAGAAPIAAVAEIWSAYYYLFALCGAALALGAWLAQRPRGWALAAVTVLAWNSARSGALPAIALVNDPWTSCSHINRHYLERGTRAVERYLSHLRAARPTLPKHSTLFFSGITGSVAFQTADGPLVRWAYRDTSLRSYYLTAFDRVKARRGPLFFFQVRNDSLGERTSERDLYYSMALGAMLGDRPEAAIELLGVERERHDSPQARYWLAWATLALGERDRSLELLRDAGFRAHAGPAPEIQEALRVVGSGDTLRAMQIARRGVASHALDPGAHALYADLVITLRADPGAAVVESYAARLLAPEWSDAWGRWAQVQAEQGRILEAAASLKRYFELAGTKGARDVELRNLERWMRERYPGAARILGPERRAP